MSTIIDPAATPFPAPSPSPMSVDREPNPLTPITASESATLPSAPTTINAGMTLVVVVDNSEFDWRPVADNGQPMDSTFRLRMVPEDVQETFRKKHTRPRQRGGRQVEETNIAAMADDNVCYAIVGWANLTGMRRRPDSGGGDGGWDQFPLECNRINKEKLPDWVKTQIYNMCSLRNVSQQALGAGGAGGTDVDVDGGSDSGGARVPPR